jgi:hypothetical protein
MGLRPAAASALMDWMLMEWQGVVHVFAGIDDGNVADAAFAKLLAPGGFEFASRRTGNVTQFVTVTNVYGVAAADMTHLSIHVDSMPLPWVADPVTVSFAARADGSEVVDIELSTLPQNTTVVFYSSGGGGGGGGALIIHQIWLEYLLLYVVEKIVLIVLLPRVALGGALQRCDTVPSVAASEWIRFSEKSDHDGRGLK